jgi:ATP-dependent Lhr-like helicase
LERLKPGDIFVLGGKLYRFLFARGMRCFVESVKDALPTIPSWFSEILPLSFDLAAEIRKVREKIKKKLEKNESKENIASWILKNFPVDENTAKSIASYFYEQHKFASIPAANEILVEKTYGIRGEKILVFHALFGRKVNDALSRAVGSYISDLLDYDVATMISDNGFAFILPDFADFEKIDTKKILLEIANSDIEEILKENVKRTELMKRRFRHCAARAFLVLRNYKGHKISVSKQQINAQTILKVFEDMEDFPVIKETYREILYDVMDLEHAKLVLHAIKSGKMKIKEISTPIASPFAHSLVVLGESDIIMMRDRRKKLLELYEKMKKYI